MNAFERGIETIDLHPRETTLVARIKASFAQTDPFQ
jgi:hypothetical protein